MDPDCDYEFINEGRKTLAISYGRVFNELYKANEMPAIKLNVTTECITPKDIETKKPQTPNMPQMPMGGGVTLGSEMPGGFDPFGGSSVIEDMPEF